MERLTIKNSDGSYSQPTHTTFEKMFYKLAEFEDFLEEQCFESLEQFSMRFDTIKTQIEGDKRVIDLLKQTIETYKNRWQKLKEFVEKLWSEKELVSEDLFFIKEKMQEFEDGKDINSLTKGEK